MDDQHTKNPANPASAKARKRYEAPRVIVREPLEAVATVCNTGMAKADPGSCPEGPIAS
jgi:hypothetical protein